MNLITSWLSRKNETRFIEPPNPVTTALHRPLHVERVEWSEYSKIRAVARRWQMSAKDKADKTAGTERARFKDCAYISECVFDHCGRKWTMTRKRLYACKDGSGTVHGLALVANNFPQLSVEYLVTNPVNIRSVVNENEPNRVEGAGRAFCQYAEKEATRRGLTSIRLNPLDSSQEFYCKVGFVPYKNNLVKTLPTISKL